MHHTAERRKRVMVYEGSKGATIEAVKKAHAVGVHAVLQRATDMDGRCAGKCTQQNTPEASPLAKKL